MSNPYLEFNILTSVEEAVAISIIKDNGGKYRFSRSEHHLIPTDKGYVPAALIDINNSCNPIRCYSYYADPAVGNPNIIAALQRYAIHGYR